MRQVTGKREAKGIIGSSRPRSRTIANRNGSRRADRRGLARDRTWALSISETARSLISGNRPCREIHCHTGRDCNDRNPSDPRSIRQLCLSGARYVRWGVQWGNRRRRSRRVRARAGGPVPTRLDPLSYPEHPSPQRSRGRQSGTDCRDRLHRRRSAGRFRTNPGHWPRSRGWRRALLGLRARAGLRRTRSHTRSHRLLVRSGSRPVLRRHAVRARMRSDLRRHSAADVDVSFQTAVAARRHAGVLRARVYAIQRPLRGFSGWCQRRPASPQHRDRRGPRRGASDRAVPAWRGEGDQSVSAGR